MSIAVAMRYSVLTAMRRRDGVLTSRPLHDCYVYQQPYHPDESQYLTDVGVLPTPSQCHV
jgi:hypothetical protein